MLLEPVSELVVTVPEANQGDIMGDLNGKRGRIQGSASVGGGEVEIVANVPTSEILRYAIDLRSMTGGRGRFTARHSHYDPVPAHLVDKIVAGRATDASRRDPRPVFGVVLGVLAEHVAVDRVELDEAADARRLVGAVDEDAPRRAADAGRATRAAPTRARPGTRRCGSRPRAPRSGRCFNGQPARKWYTAMRPSRTGAEEQAAVVAREPGREQRDAPITA